MVGTLHRPLLSSPTRREKPRHNVPSKRTSAGREGGITSEGPRDGASRIRGVGAHVARPDVGGEVVAEGRVAAGDLLQGGLDALGDRQPGPLGGGGGCAVPAPQSYRCRELAREEIDLRACRGGPSRIVEALRLGELFPKFREPPLVGSLGSRVEQDSG